MNRLIIVDDEPMIVNGLYYFLQNCTHLELELYKATDAYQALELIDKYRMDIVLTDIQMPGMTGMELQLKILERWPRCKLIFLTGYNEFAYIQSAFRHGAVDYIMKTEGYDKILEVVENTIGAISREFHNENHRGQAKLKMQQAAPLLWRDYLYNLLSDDKLPAQTRSKQFADIGLPLAWQMPVILVVGKIDHWGEEFSFSDKNLILYALQNIAEEYLSHACVSVSFAYETHKIIWFIQPGQADPLASESFIRQVHGILESVQNSCREYLKLTVSLIMSTAWCEWDKIGEKFGTLNTMLSYGLGSGTEQLLTEQSYLQQLLQVPANNQSGQAWELQRLLNQFGNCEKYLDSHDEAQFLRFFTEVTNALKERFMASATIALEIFTTLGLFFLSYMNRQGLIEQMSANIELDKLLDINKHKSWDDITTYFKAVAACIFRFAREQQTHSTTNIVAIVQQYMKEHIREVTLTKLAENVYLNPSYLSRLYKQTTGISLSDSIKELKIAKAIEMLRDPHMKIQDIMLALGFESHSYFTQFFKKQTGFTPQEYRHSVLKL